MAHNNSSLKPLLSSEKKSLLEKLEVFYGIDITPFKDQFFYINSKGKIHISPIDISKLDLARVNSLGLYFGSLHDGDRFRPSIEGSQLIKPKKNIVRLTEKGLQSYISAENLFEEEVEYVEIDLKCPFYIVEFEGEFLGAVSIRDKILTTYVSKGRKLDYNKLF